LFSPGFFFYLLYRRVRFRQQRLRYLFSELTIVKFSFTLAHILGQHDLSNMAASISYFAFLSLFPLILALIAVFGLILPSETVQQQMIDFFAQYLPGSVSVIQSNIPDIIRFRSAFGTAGIIGLFWSGTGVFSAVSRGINRAWNIKYEHPFYIRKPRELGMILGTGILFLLSLGTSAALSFISGLNLPVPAGLVNLATIFLAFSFSFVIFILLYKVAPLSWISWRYVWPGALLAALLFEIAKTLFIFYLNHYNSYNNIYGPLASVIVLLVWIYYSAFILLLGAEFGSLLFRLKREGEALFKPADKKDLVSEIHE
jgi:membrane protein